MPRVYAALVLRRRGASLAEVAASLPNSRGDDPSRGVSTKTAELLLRAGARTLLTGVLMDRQPEGLRGELWPPESVRDEVRSIPRALARRERTDALRRWLEGGTSRHPEPAGAGPISGRLL